MAFKANYNFQVHCQCQGLCPAHLTHLFNSVLLFPLGVAGWYLKLNVKILPENNLPVFPLSINGTSISVAQTKNLESILVVPPILHVYSIPAYP